MTLEFLPADRQPGYAGPLAARHPALAGRYHFWRGSSGRRYACTRFALTRVPAYQNALLLYVRRHGEEAAVLGVGTSERLHSVPCGTEEVHVHLLADHEELQAAVEDLSRLVARRPPLYVIERRAA